MFGKLIIWKKIEEYQTIFSFHRVSRVDTGEHSCVGVVKKGDRILVPKWCVYVGDEPRGRVAIYSQKPTGEVKSFTRSCPYKRYDEQFDLVYQDDDLRELIQPADGSRGTDLPYVVVLKIPKELSRLTVGCFWGHGDVFNNPSTTVVVSYVYGPNGEFFLQQKLVDEVVKRKETYLALKEGVEDVAEVLLSVNHDDNSWIFEGFFDEPPKKSITKKQ